MARHKISKANVAANVVDNSSNNTCNIMSTTPTITTNGNILNHERIRNQAIANNVHTNDDEKNAKDTTNFTEKNDTIVDNQCSKNRHLNVDNGTKNNNIFKCSHLKQQQQPPPPQEQKTSTTKKSNKTMQSSSPNNDNNVIENNDNNDGDDDDDNNLINNPNIEKSKPSLAAHISAMLHSGAKILSRAKHYLFSLRPGSFFTSLIPVLIGTVLAYKINAGQFSWIILLATLITVISVHAAGNLVNTYGDFVRGIDSKPQSDDRTLVDSILTPEEVVNLGVLFYVIGCIGFVVVVLLSPARMELLAFIYFGGISSSFLYTGGIGLKYIAMGDLIIMITFGPVSVLYSFVAQTGTIRLVTLLYAIPLALNAEAILHSNNTRDIDVDRKAGCVTIAILIGYQASHVLFALLLFIPYILFFVMSINYSLWFLLPLITLPKAFLLEKRFRQRQLCSIPKQMAILNFYFGMFYLFACFMSPAHKLPGLLSSDR